MRIQETIVQPKQMNNNNIIKCCVCNRKQGVAIPSMKMFKHKGDYYCSNCFPTSDKIMSRFNKKQGW